MILKSIGNHFFSSRRPLRDCIEKWGEPKCSQTIRSKRTKSVYIHMGSVPVCQRFLSYAGIKKKSAWSIVEGGSTSIRNTGPHHHFVGTINYTADQIEANILIIQILNQFEIEKKKHISTARRRTSSVPKWMLEFILYGICRAAAAFVGAEIE